MKRNKNNRKNSSGFTISELVLALSVTSVILAAAATLAFAMNTAEAATNKIGEKQAHLRVASVRTGELFRNSFMAFPYSTTGIIFWVSDINADGKINGEELVWLTTDESQSNIRLIEFPGQTMEVTRDGLKNGSDLNTLYNDSSHLREATLLFDCANVVMTIDSNEKFVIIDFDFEENGIWKSYQLCGGLRAESNFMYDYYGNFVSGDDDI